MRLATLVLPLALSARAFLEPKWVEWRVERNIAPVYPRPESTGMCRVSSCFMRFLLGEELPEGDWLIRGGCAEDHDDVDPEAGVPSGYRDAAGNWHGHYWLVEAASGMIVDVTADQFDGAAIVVDSPSMGSSTQETYRRNYRPEAVDRHLIEDAAVAATWFEEWKRHRAGREREVAGTAASRPIRRPSMPLAACRSPR